MTYPKWPHLENLDRAREVLNADVLFISDKIDGFNARFGRTQEGEFWIGTRNTEIDTSLYADDLANENDAQGFAAWAWSQRDKVGDGITYFGEWAGTGIQNRIQYGPKQFYLFGIMTYIPYKESHQFVIPTMVEIEADYHGWARPNILHWGPNPGIERLEEWRSRENTEGIVIFPWPMVYDKWNNPLIAKFKNPAFEERKSHRESKPVTVPEDMKTLVEEYATWERMLHVFQHIQMQLDRGIQSPWEIEHTGTYLQVFHQDVVEDAKHELENMDPNTVKQLGKFLNPVAKHLRDEYVAQLHRAEHGGEA